MEEQKPKWMKKSELVGKPMILKEIKTVRSKLRPGETSDLITAKLLETGEDIIFYSAAVLSKQVAESSLIGKKVVIGKRKGRMTPYFAFREVG
ncbi:MAG: hypothetical protein QXW57_04295 [Candidatus Micrarchaeaceae archaeon]